MIALCFNLLIFTILGPREQMNQLTAYLDLSFVYGSDNCDAKILRSFSGGKLNVTRVSHGKALLPETKDNEECRSKSRICFNAGDFLTAIYY